MTLREGSQMWKGRDCTVHRVQSRRNECADCRPGSGNCVGGWGWGTGFTVGPPDWAFCVWDSHAEPRAILHPGSRPRSAHTYRLRPVLPPALPRVVDKGPGGDSVVVQQADDNHDHHRDHHHHDDHLGELQLRYDEEESESARPRATLLPRPSWDRNDFPQACCPRAPLCG